jgi:hypothetical protein
MWFNLYCLIGFFALVLFLGSISLQLIKMEKRLENVIDTLEKELVAVFGRPSSKGKENR